METGAGGPGVLRPLEETSGGDLLLFPSVWMELTLPRALAVRFSLYIIAATKGMWRKFQML